MFRRMAPRHFIVVVCFLATFCVYVERLGFSIAYTRMAKEAGVDEAVKGRVLSVFYWGYALSQVPGGALSQRFGGRPLLLVSFAAWSTASFLTPTDANRHLYMTDIVVARLLTGIFQGCVIPSVHTVLSQWIPPPERAIATSVTTSGMYLGSAGAMWILPSVAEVVGYGGLLKFVGSLGLCWCVLWFFAGKGAATSDHDLPIAHRKSHQLPNGQRSTPWTKILTSIPVWAIIINNFTFHYSVYVVMNWLPTYFNELLRAELSSLGVIKSLPYITMFLSSITGGWLGDYFILRWKTSVAAGRKIVNSIGFAGAAGALMMMPLAGSVWMGVVWTTLVMGALGLSRGGFSVNHMDIAPSYAGIVMGISNTAGTLSGVIGVAVTGAILEGSGGSMLVDGWMRAFTVAALLCVMGSVFFVRYAKGERLFE